MQTTTSIPQVEIQPVEKTRRPMAPVHAIPARKVERHGAEKWILGLLVALICVFTLSFVVRVLQPENSGVNTANTWTADGP